MKSINYYIKHPQIVGVKILDLFSPLIKDKTYIKIRWRILMGYKLDLENPQTYNEKLQWIKLYDHNPLYSVLVDKYRVKEYVANKIGKEYVIPLLGVWDNVEDIEWNNLPNQFVLKTNHGCGGMIICKDKSKLNIVDAIKILEKSLKEDYYYQGREWPYKNVIPKIFAEKYMEDEYGELRDYKFFCFNGKPKALFIASDRGNLSVETKFDFFDIDFNHLPFINGHPNADICPIKPSGFEQMRDLAAELSKEIPEVRVDFYDINGNIYFGEFTFFHWGGMKPFEPREWDYKFGSWIDLPRSKKV